MDSIAIANSMLKLCENPNLIKEFGKVGRSRVERCYGYDKMINSYLNAYKEAMEKWQA